MFEKYEKLLPIAKTGQIQVQVEKNEYLFNILAV